LAASFAAKQRIAIFIPFSADLKQPQKTPAFARDDRDVPDMCGFGSDRKWGGVAVA
jgi:hypothetical protein